jgi:hypothetical protein
MRSSSSGVEQSGTGVLHALVRGKCGEERDYDNLGEGWARHGRSAPGRGACWMRLLCASSWVLGLRGRMGLLLERALQHIVSNLPDVFTDYKGVTKFLNPAINVPSRVEVPIKTIQTPKGGGKASRHMLLISARRLGRRTLQ